MLVNHKICDESKIKPEIPRIRVVVVKFPNFGDSDGEGKASVGGSSMLTAATGERKNAKRDSNPKRNYRKRRGASGGPLGRGGGTFGGTETQTSVISAAAYESVDPGENGEVVYCSLQDTRLVQIDLTHMVMQAFYIGKV